MGLDVFSRIKDIVSANIDELLNKAEDPELMADQMVRKYEDAIRDLLGSAASIKASAKEAKQQLDGCDADIKKYGEYARLALTEGNEERARQAIQLKQEKESLRPVLLENYETVQAQADRAEAEYRKLTSGLEQVKARAQAMKNTVKAAKVKNVTEALHYKSVSAATGVSGKLDKLEAKANRMMNEAEAREELMGKGKNAAELDALYGKPSDSAVDQELKALKEQMGL